MNIQSILEKLISFKTITGNNKEVIKSFNWIKKQFNGLPLYMKIISCEDVPSLIITTQKTKKPILWLAAHIDVVPASDNLFKPIVKKDCLYGRGVFDMKFAIACYIKLVLDFKEKLKNYNFGLMITADEETGGFKGTKYLLDNDFSSKICILPDGGNNLIIEKQAKGVWHFSVESYGKSAHGSRPWQGDNAIDNLMKFLFKLKKYFKDEPCGDNLHHHSTVNIGKIEGGEVANKIPDYARALVDIRFTSNKEIKKIENIIKKMQKNISVKIKTISRGSSYYIDTDDRYVQLFLDIAQKKYNVGKISEEISHGSSDARFFGDKNIQSIITRPKGGGLHSNEEWIDLKDLYKFYEILKEFVNKSTLIK